LNKIHHSLCIPLLLLLLLNTVLLPDQSQAGPDAASGKKVLIVASYHPEYKWVEEIVTTLRNNLRGAELTVFYMDTKRHLEGAEQKAREAFALYQEIKPDAVITIDDNAQAYFVVPYLKDKVDTPVIFCAVNDDAGKYGFPAANVTGVLEKKHYRESISFAQIIRPGIRRVGVLYRPSPSNAVNLGQIEKEKDTYSAQISAVTEVQDLAELRRAVTDMEDQVDALFILNLTGITDDEGRQMEGHDAIRAVAENTWLVTIGASDWEIEAGALCGVIKSGEEQGNLAADLLLEYWAGKNIAELPITQNKNGQRFINLSTLKKLNIQLRPEMIMGTKIIPGS